MAEKGILGFELNFGYGVNFKYEGMFSHSFDRFYIVTKFELPKTEDLKLATYQVSFTTRGIKPYTKL